MAKTWHRLPRSGVFTYEETRMPATKTVKLHPLTVVVWYALVTTGLVDLTNWLFSHL